MSFGDQNTLVLMVTSQLNDLVIKTQLFGDQKLLTRGKVQFISIYYKLKLINHKEKTKNQKFEERLLNVISSPHLDIMTQIDAIAYNISFVYFCCMLLFK